MSGKQSLPVAVVPDSLVPVQLIKVMLGSAPGQIRAAQFLQIDQRDFSFAVLPAVHYVLVVEAAMLQAGSVHSADCFTSGNGQLPFFVCG